MEINDSMWSQKGATLSDPDHEQHEEMLEWSDKFDPEKFDSKKASKKMQRGMAKGKDAD